MQTFHSALAGNQNLRKLATIHVRGNTNGESFASKVLFQIPPAKVYQQNCFLPRWSLTTSVDIKKVWVLALFHIILLLLMHK